MDKWYKELFDFLSNYLENTGFTIRCSIEKKPEELPIINGYKPDLVATYKNSKTVYGVVELPGEVYSKEQWERLRALSDKASILLYLAFPEQEKMNLILSLINGKLSDRKNIIRVYKS